MVNDNVDISLAMIRTILDDISTVHITTTFRFATLPHWQCDQIWRNFAILAKLKKVFSKSVSVALVFGKTIIILWQVSILLGNFSVWQNSQKPKII